MSEFKIIASGTHDSLGIRPEGGPAEPATAAPEGDNTAGEPNTDSGEPPATEPGTPATPQSTPPGATTPASSEPPKSEPPAAPPTEEEQLKALGYDEQFIAIAKQYKADGNINRYVQAASTDYSKMSPEQILRIDLQRQYPGATAEQLDLLYDTEVKGKYKLDPDVYPPDGKDAQAGALKMKLDADSLRAKLIQENEGLKLPSRDLQAEAQQRQAEVERQAQERNNAFMASDFSKGVLTNKKMTYSIDGAPAFNYEINPTEVAGIVTNPKLLAETLSDGKGGTNHQAAWDLATFLKDRHAYRMALINYGKTLGKDEMIDEKTNPPKQAGNPAAPARETLAEAFANRGKHGRGG